MKNTNPGFLLCMTFLRTFKNYHVFFANTIAKAISNCQKMFQLAKNRLMRMFGEKEKKQDGISDSEIMERNPSLLNTHSCPQISHVRSRGACYL